MPSPTATPPATKRHLSATALAAALFLSACGGGGGGGAAAPAPPPATVAAPTIGTGPAAASVTAGQAATFNVSAGGSGLSYQWRVDGTDIAGATGASYTTPATVAGDSGKTYSVVVSNAGGSVTSAAATLTVTAAASTPAVAATQDAAQALVVEVNARVADVRTAGLTLDLPLGAQVFALPTAAVFSETIPCAQLAEGGGSGSGSVDYTFTTNDANGAPVSGSFLFNACRVEYAGSSFSANGRGSVVYDRYVNEEDYVITFTYDDIVYEVSTNGYVESGTLDLTETCTYLNGTETCSSTIGDSRISEAEVEQNGSLTTVRTARVVGGTLTIVYEGWVFDTATGRATAGTVTVTDGAGNRAVISVGSGGYTVVVTLAGGSSTTWNVPFPG